jgi:Fe-S-cluster containining protein
MLQRGDDPKKLKDLGLPLAKSRAQLKFPQPCAAFDGCRCCIYANRPVYCRKFECFLFKQVFEGKLEEGKALRIIRVTKLKVAKAHRLLRQLGDLDEDLALSVRFRRTSKRLARGHLSDEEAKLFAELTQVVHSLNLILGESFYPAAGSIE